MTLGLDLWLRLFANFIPAAQHCGRRSSARSWAVVAIVTSPISTCRPACRRRFGERQAEETAPQDRPLSDWQPQQLSEFCR